MFKHKRSQSIDVVLSTQDEVKNKSLKIDTADKSKKKKHRSLTPSDKSNKTFSFEVRESKSLKKQKMTEKRNSGINISLHEKNKKVNHCRHFCLCMITFGVWIPCWLGSCCCNCCYNPCDF